MSICQLVFWSFTQNFLKREITLSCTYRSTCYDLNYNYIHFSCSKFDHRNIIKHEIISKQKIFSDSFHGDTEIIHILSISNSSVRRIILFFLYESGRFDYTWSSLIQIVVVRIDVCICFSHSTRFNKIDEQGKEEVHIYVQKNLH